MWVIVSADRCNFCADAKALLKSSGCQYVEYNVSTDSSKWLLSLLKKANLTTVPQIFMPDGTHIGGYNELKQHILKGW